MLPRAQSRRLELNFKVRSPDLALDLTVQNLQERLIHLEHHAEGVLSCQIRQLVLQLHVSLQYELYDTLHITVQLHVDDLIGLR